MRHLLSITDLSVEEIDALLETAADIEANPEAYAHKMEGKKLATLFFEPSTRTRLSFEAAMYELGGHVIGFAGASNSSAAKGESVKDTVRTVGCYADIIAMRHPLEGAPWAAVQAATTPVINAGDGGHHHPTQTLADLMTLKKEKGRLDHLKIGLCGDLRFGRTVHSLIEALSRYPGNEFVMISPRELRVPGHIVADLAEAGIPYKEAEALEEALPDLDALYMTRIQQERFFSPEEYLRLKDSYILDEEKMRLAPADMIVMHPLPRVNEIDVKVDADPRACYFKQVFYGKIMRMALILKLMGETELPPKPGRVLITTGKQCKNPRCISSTEQGLEPLFYPVHQVMRHGQLTRIPTKYVCAYCDMEQV
ncbi:MAG: aspartate carbamoyltransferase [Clostridia bacterium]|nr:aspartate carbamoyltransferase [Clostridia bacterium]